MIRSQPPGSATSSMSGAHRVLEDVGRGPAALAGRQAEVEAVGREVAPAHAPAVEVDERVLVVHPERRRGEAEPLVDEVLAEPVLAREAHRPELAVHPPGEAAVRVDPPAEPVARLEDRDPVPRLLEQQPGREPGDAGAHDDDVAAARRCAPAGRRGGRPGGRSWWPSPHLTGALQAPGPGRGGRVGVPPPRPGSASCL